jgi:hypothetical protein
VYIHGDIFVFSEFFNAAYVIEMAVGYYEFFYYITLLINYVGQSFALGAAVEQKAVLCFIVDAEKRVRIVSVIIRNYSFYHFTAP